MWFRGKSNGVVRHKMGTLPLSQVSALLVVVIKVQTFWNFCIFAKSWRRLCSVARQPSVAEICISIRLCFLSDNALVLRRGECFFSFQYYGRISTNKAWLVHWQTCFYLLLLSFILHNNIFSSFSYLKVKVKRALRILFVYTEFAVCWTCFRSGGDRCTTRLSPTSL